MIAKLRGGPLSGKRIAVPEGSTELNVSSVEFEPGQQVMVDPVLAQEGTYKKCRCGSCSYFDWSGPSDPANSIDELLDMLLGRSDETNDGAPDGFMAGLSHDVETARAKKFEKHGKIKALVEMRAWLPKIKHLLDTCESAIHRDEPEKLMNEAVHVELRKLTPREVLDFSTALNLLHDYTEAVRNHLYLTTTERENHEDGFGNSFEEAKKAREKEMEDARLGR